MQNHLSQLPMQNKFYSSHWFFKNKILYFYFFPIVKMYAFFGFVRPEKKKKKKKKKMYVN